MHDHQPVPICPFCGAGWTPAMLAQLDSLSSAASCACCGDDAHIHAAPLPTPTDDLCCESCGRAIYLKPGSAPA